LSVQTYLSLCQTIPTTLGCVREQASILQSSSPIQTIAGPWNAKS
jgi:hypothetical protein